MGFIFLKIPNCGDILHDFFSNNFADNYYYATEPVQLLKTPPSEIHSIIMLTNPDTIRKAQQMKFFHKYPKVAIYRHPEDKVESTYNYLTGHFDYPNFCVEQNITIKQQLERITTNFPYHANELVYWCMSQQESIYWQKADIYILLEDLDSWIKQHFGKDLGSQSYDDLWLLQGYLSDKEREMVKEIFPGDYLINNPVETPILWINCRIDVARHKYMEKLFDKYKLPNVRIEAYDGRLRDNFINNSLRASLPEVACTCSHLKAMYYFVNESSLNYLDGIFISEDDLSFDFAKYWQKTLYEYQREALGTSDDIHYINFCPNISGVLGFHKDTSNGITYLNLPRGESISLNKAFTPKRKYDGAVLYWISRNLINEIFKTIKYDKDKDKWTLSDNHTSQIADVFFHDYIYLHNIRILPLVSSRKDNDSNLHEHHISHHLQNQTIIEKAWIFHNSTMTNQSILTSVTNPIPNLTDANLTQPRHHKHNHNHNHNRSKKRKKKRTIPPKDAVRNDLTNATQIDSD